MYEAKAITTTIKATSRVSIKIRDNFYTVEYTEERQIPQDIDLNIDEERRALWDTCNSEVDNQILEIEEMVKK